MGDVVVNFCERRGGQMAEEKIYMVLDTASASGPHLFMRVREESDDNAVPINIYIDKSQLLEKMPEPYSRISAIISQEPGAEIVPGVPISYAVEKISVLEGRAMPRSFGLNPLSPPRIP